MARKLVWLAVVVAGCGSAAVGQGGLRQSCAGGNSCNPGLTCESGVCVMLGAAGQPGSGGAANQGGNGVAGNLGGPAGAGGAAGTGGGGAAGAGGQAGGGGAAGAAGGGGGAAGAGGAAAGGTSGDTGGAAGAGGKAGAPGTGGTSGSGGAPGTGGIGGSGGAAGTGGAGGAAGTSGAGGAAGAATIPFANYLVLRLETDAPNGVQANGAWQDLSSAAHPITIATGTPQVVVTAGSGARSLLFGSSGPIFQVADTADLRFGATDDFFVVARVTIEAPTMANSCLNHYLVSKLAADQTGPVFYDCQFSAAPVMHGALKINLVESFATAPQSTGTGFGVVSFGRNASGTRIETFVAGTLTEATVTPTDVSATGSAFGIGGLIMQGTPAAPWAGKINRLYVFHAPPGTFGVAGFDAIRTYVASATPLP